MSWGDFWLIAPVVFVISLGAGYLFGEFMNRR